MVTNQSGIARGCSTRPTTPRPNGGWTSCWPRRARGSTAHYHCPHLPEITGPCDCRKPGPLLYRRAAERLGSISPRSWWVGDRLRDVLPAERFGGRGLLLVRRPDPDELSSLRCGAFSGRVPDLAAAVEIILAAACPPPASDYLPPP